MLTLAASSNLQHKKQGQHQNAQQQLPQSSKQPHRPELQRLSRVNCDLTGCCMLIPKKIN